MTDVARTLAAVVVWTAFASCTLDHLIGRGEAPGPPGANTLGMGDGGQAAVTCYVLDPLFGDADTLLVSADMASGMFREVTRWTTPQDMNLACGMAYDGSVFLVPAHSRDGTSWYALSPSTGEVQLLGGAGHAKSVGWTGTDCDCPARGSVHWRARAVPNPWRIARRHAECTPAAPPICSVHRRWRPPLWAQRFPPRGRGSIALHRQPLADSTDRSVGKRRQWHVRRRERRLPPEQPGRRGVCDHLLP